MTAPGDETPNPTRQYEFTPEEGHLIGDLAAKMRFVGLLTTTLGVLALLSALLAAFDAGLNAALVVAFLTAGLLTAFGVWTQHAAREFQLVEQTQGRDISHLMIALQNLHKLFAVQYWIGWVGLLILIVVMVFGYFIDPAH